MNNQYSYKKMSAEDRAIIVLSIHYTLELRKSVTAKAEELQAIAEELFQQQPKIAPCDIPLLYGIVRDFYCSLVLEGNRPDSEAASKGIYQEVVDQCKQLMHKMEDYCQLHRIDLTSSLRH